MADTLNATARDQLGTRNSRRLRRAGQIPAVLYGHGQESLSLTISGGDLHAAIRHGAKLVDIAGAANDSALISEIQWDALGSEILHLDLIRVSKDEAVSVNVAIELRGEAPGTNEGGVLDHVLHQVEIECRADSIPDRLAISVNNLHVGDTLTVGDLELPDGAKLNAEPDAIVAQCNEAVEQPDEDEAIPGAGAIEPEVIGKKEEEGEGDD